MVYEIYLLCELALFIVKNIHLCFIKKIIKNTDFWMKKEMRNVRWCRPQDFAPWLTQSLNQRAGCFGCGLRSSHLVGLPWPHLYFPSSGQTGSGIPRKRWAHESSDPIPAPPCPASTSHILSLGPPRPPGTPRCQDGCLWGRVPGCC